MKSDMKGSCLAIFQCCFSWIWGITSCDIAQQSFCFLIVARQIYQFLFPCCLWFFFCCCSKKKEERKCNIGIWKTNSLSNSFYYWCFGRGVTLQKYLRLGWNIYLMSPLASEKHLLLAKPFFFLFFLFPSKSCATEWNWGSKFKYSLLCHLVLI